ncbi:hypothetical protein CDR68_16135 [Salmonella enterica]|nr:hypothetical protein [Salmonella enterica]
MEDVKLYVQLAGVEPSGGADICIARRESTAWHKDIVAELINRVLDDAEKFAGAPGLEGLRVYDVMLGIGLTSSGIWPGFSLDPNTISRMSDCGAALDFDPYIENVPTHACAHETHDDFTVAFSALGFHHQRSVIAIRGLREYASVADVFIFQVFKDALKYHNDNSLRLFRKKQSELTIYARYYQAESCGDEGCTTCHESNARFRYCPFEKRRLSV